MGDPTGPPTWTARGPLSEVATGDLYQLETTLQLVGDGGLYAEQRAGFAATILGQLSRKLAADFAKADTSSPTSTWHFTVSIERLPDG